MFRIHQLLEQYQRLESHQDRCDFRTGCTVEELHISADQLLILLQYMAAADSRRDRISAKAVAV